MGCKINSCSHPILSKFPTKTPSFIHTSSSSSIQSKLRTHPISFSSSSSSNQNQQEPIITTTTTTQQNLYHIEFKTLKACKLGISIFPDFVYNADGGNGIGTGTKNVNKLPNDHISVCFDLQTLYIPPLTSETTRFLGLPLPPFLKINIVPELLQGTIDEDTGKVELEFKAKFWFSVGSVYRAPPLFVQTVLTSEESKGSMRKGEGERLNKEGKCRLVGVATLDPIDDIFMNSFLGLPTECLADLNATIHINGS